MKYFNKFIKFRHISKTIGFLKKYFGLKTFYFMHYVHEPCFNNPAYKKFGAVFCKTLILSLIPIPGHFLIDIYNKIYVNSSFQSLNKANF